MSNLETLAFLIVWTIYGAVLSFFGAGLFWAMGQEFLPLFFGYFGGCLLCIWGFYGIPAFVYRDKRRA